MASFTRWRIGSLALLIALVSGIKAGFALETLSVLYFENTAKAERVEWLAKGLADMLTSDLGETGAFSVVERQSLQKVLAEQEFAHSALGDPKTAPELGKLLGAKTLVYGSFALSGDSLRIDARAVTVATGAIQAHASASGRPEKALELERSIASQLAAGLGTKLKPATQDTSSVEAARHYYEGVSMADSKRWEEAANLFTQASREDPSWIKPGKGLEDAYRFLRDFRKQRARREMNALTEDIAELRRRIDSARFPSFSEALTNPKAFGFADAAAVSEAYSVRPRAWAGESRVQAVWNLQTMLYELGNLAEENFADEAFSRRCLEEMVGWAREAERRWPKDEFLPEVLYQELFALRWLSKWKQVKAAAERLMERWPDFRMMWSIEDIYEKCLDELSGS